MIRSPHNLKGVIPAKAGISSAAHLMKIPAFAGMTAIAFAGLAALTFAGMTLVAFGTKPHRAEESSDD